MKGITPVISIIILLLVTISLAGAAYMYVAVYMGSITSKVIQVGDAFCAAGEANVILNNAGTSDISITASLMQTNPYQPDANTRALWHLDEGSGATGFDATGNHNGMLSGPFSWVPGRFGSAVDFSGTAGMVTTGAEMAIPYSPVLAINTFTLEFWIKPESFNPPFARGIILGAAGDGRDSGYRVLTVDDGGSNGFIRLQVNYVGGPGPGMEPAWFDSGTKFPLDQLTHVAIVFQSGANPKVYVNGNLSSLDISMNGETLGDINYAGATDMMIGRAQWHFDGVIDEVRFYNGVIDFTTKQPSWNYVCPLSGSTAACTDFSVTKGGGTLGSYFDASLIPRSGVATLKDPCSGTCDYRITTGSGSRTATVRC
ncbi:MAG: hypothetical protein HY367_04455 [Candidatus Aenigmarchaeota archaeon]|nr:hypothetical protein [Candidatus Aenigmarchaeota archaeon]